MESLVTHLYKRGLYLYEWFDETGAVPGILMKIEPIETGQRNEGHLEYDTMLS